MQTFQNGAFLSNCIIDLFNLNHQCSVPLMLGPSAIAKSLVFLILDASATMKCARHAADVH